jgi:transcriptional regulator with XRE-family HTH domain
VAWDISVTGGGILPLVANWFKVPIYTGIFGATMLPEDQRRLLGAFLRGHREAIAPDPTVRGRRRTAGLRREEVGQLCGLSTTWYTWVEQGRDIAVSAAALARLAEGLRLTGAERTYLFELARRRDPAPPLSGPGTVAVPPELAAVLRAATVPAYLLDRLWHVRDWNDPAGRLFAPWFDSGETSLLRYVFLNPTAGDFIWDWENRARRLVAELRADTARDPDDRAMRDLLDGLGRESEAFARFWNNHAVLAREGGERVFNHPLDGMVRYEQVTLLPASHRGHKMVILLPKFG